MISLAGKVTADLVEINGGFMTNVTCGLTAKKPGSSPCPKLVVKYGTITTLIIILQSFTKITGKLFTQSANKKTLTNRDCGDYMTSLVHRGNRDYDSNT